MIEEPLERIAGLYVVEQRLDRNPCASEDRSSAKDPRIAVDHRV